MKYLIILLMLTGCITPEMQRAQQQRNLEQVNDYLDDVCTERGYKKKTKRFEACVRVAAEEFVARHNAQQQQLIQQQQFNNMALSNQMRIQPYYVPQRSGFNCTSTNYIPGSINTSCR